MKKAKFFWLGGLAVMAGVLAAAIVAPHLYIERSDPGAMHASWADHYSSLGQMVNDVDAVVLATVIGTQPGREVLTASQQPLPFTLVSLKADEIIRGYEFIAEGQTITLEQTGGEINGQALYFNDDGGFYTPGGKELLFLKRQEDTGYYYLVNPQGRFKVKDDQLLAVAPDDHTAQQLDLRSVDHGLRIILDEIRP